MSTARRQMTGPPARLRVPADFAGAADAGALHPPVGFQPPVATQAATPHDESGSESGQRNALDRPERSRSLDSRTPCSIEVTTTSGAAQANPARSCRSG